MSSEESLYWLLYSCANPIFAKSKSVSWDMVQNALGQTDCRIFKSTISLEQTDEIAWFFICWYKCMEIKCWLKKLVNNGCSHSDHRTLNLVVSEEGSNNNNNKLIFGMVMQIEPGKLKVTLIIFGWWWLCHLGHGTLKSAVSQA